MSGRALKARLGDEYPAPPEGWEPGDYTDPHGAWVRGLAELKAAGADDSGAMKQYRVAVPLAWQTHLHGGSVHTWRKRLSAAEVSMSEAQQRVGLNEKAGRDSDEALRVVAAAAKNIATHRALVEAAELWTGDDNVVLRQRFEDAEGYHAGAVSTLKRHRGSGLPVPAGLEERIYAAEKALVAAREAYARGRETFERVGRESQAASRQSYNALAGSLCNLMSALGAEVRKVVRAGDVEFLASFPHRAPAEVRAIHGRAGLVAEIIRQLDARRDPWAHFWSAVEELTIAQIVAASAGLELDNVARRVLSEVSEGSAA